MKTTITSQYGLMSIGYIAMHPQDGNIIAETIAKEYNIPLDYLVKILQHMVKAGILNSKRGPRGGYTMGREPEKITLLEVFEAIDGPSISEHYIAEITGHERFAVKMEKVCDKAIAEQNKVLQETTLAELVGSSKK